MHLLSNPIQDGGQWDMWVNLVDKYGVVPQSEMPESYSSSNSRYMNRLITRKLRENAMLLRNSVNKGSSTSDVQQQKTDMLEEVYKMLTIHLGTPPNSFNWQTRDKKKNFLRFEGLTPTSFYKEHVGLDLDDYVCLITCFKFNKEIDLSKKDFLDDLVLTVMVKKNTPKKKSALKKQGDIKN